MANVFEITGELLDATDALSSAAGFVLDPDGIIQAIGQKAGDMFGAAAGEIFTKLETTHLSLPC
jgi:hypothetical protein